MNKSNDPAKISVRITPQETILKLLQPIMNCRKNRHSSSVLSLPIAKMAIGSSEAETV